MVYSLISLRYGCSDFAVYYQSKKRMNQQEEKDNYSQRGWMEHLGCDRNHDRNHDRVH